VHNKARSPNSESAQGDIASLIRALDPWFHNFRFGTLQTAPSHFLGDYPMVKWRRFERALPPDLQGASVLDIGCNGGFYSIEMKRRGAGRVLGIDVDERYLKQAQLAAELSGVEIELRQMSVYQIADLRERFDIVLFMGVLYHLRHPLLALDLIREHAARRLVIVQSMLRGERTIIAPADDYPFSNEAIFTTRGYPAMYFVEHRYAGDPTNWWVPNASALAGMLRSAGLAPVARPEEEVFVCGVEEDTMRRSSVEPRSLSATLETAPQREPGCRRRLSLPPQFESGRHLMHNGDHVGVAPGACSGVRCRRFVTSQLLELVDHCHLPPVAILDK
jgi:tRNA (mo5U34)-methyltransferase